MKKIQILFVIIFVIISQSAIAQESKDDKSTEYDYYVEQESDEEKVVQEAQAQPSGESSFTDKVFFGGGFGAGFGSYTFINVSPIVGYRVTERLSVGIRLMYQYTTFEYYDWQRQETERYNGHDLGIGGFATYKVYGPVFLQAEYEHLSYEALYVDGSSRRTSFDSFMAGGGIMQPMGPKAVLFLMALYNFSYDSFDQTDAYRFPYNSPWVIRIGVSAGF